MQPGASDLTAWHKVMQVLPTLVAGLAGIGLLVITWLERTRPRQPSQQSSDALAAKLDAIHAELREQRATCAQCPRLLERVEHVAGRFENADDFRCAYDQQALLTAIALLLYKHREPGGGQ